MQLWEGGGGGREPLSFLPSFFQQCIGGGGGGGGGWPGNNKKGEEGGRRGETTQEQNGTKRLQTLRSEGGRGKGREEGEERGTSKNRESLLHSLSFFLLRKCQSFGKGMLIDSWIYEARRSGKVTAVQCKKYFSGAAAARSISLSEAIIPCFWQEGGSMLGRMHAI